MLSKEQQAKTLVTGGNGGLGTAARKLFPHSQYPRRTEMDVCNRDQIFDYFSKHSVETVIHLAAMAGIALCEQDPELAYQTNVNGTRYLLEAARQFGAKRFVLVSTACVFSGQHTGECPDERTVPIPKHYYGTTKLAAEEIAKTFDSSELQVTVVRTNFSAMPWSYPRAFTDRYGTYLFAEGVMQGISDILESSGHWPIVHICGDKRISMYEYARLGGSQVEPLTLTDYQGPPLTIDMSIQTKVWHPYSI